MTVTNAAPPSTRTRGSMRSRRSHPTSAPAPAGTTTPRPFPPRTSTICAGRPARPDGARASTAATVCGGAPTTRPTTSDRGGSRGSTRPPRSSCRCTPTRSGYISRHAHQGPARRAAARDRRRGPAARVGGQRDQSPRSASPASTRRSSSRRRRLAADLHKFFASLGPAADSPADLGRGARRAAVPRAHGDGAGAAACARGRADRQWDVHGHAPDRQLGRARRRTWTSPPELVIGAPGTGCCDDPRTFTLGFTANHVGSRPGRLRRSATSSCAQRPYLAESDLTQIALGDARGDSASACARRCTRPRGAWEQGDPASAEAESLKAAAPGQAGAARHHQPRPSTSAARARRSGRTRWRQMYRDARTFTLHFRDESTCASSGKALLADRFVASRAGSTRRCCPQRNA